MFATSSMRFAVPAVVLVLSRTLYAQEPVEAAEPPEPPPAPLVIPAPEPPVAPPEAAKNVPAAQPSASPRQAPARAPGRPYLIAGYSGAAVTLSLVVAGTTLGLLAQSRADELHLTAAQLSTGGPVAFDEAAQKSYLELQHQGRTFNQAAIACLVIGGITAVLSGVLFWNAAARTPKNSSLALGIAPSADGAWLSTSGRF